MKETNPYGFRNLLINRRSDLNLSQRDFARRLYIPLTTYKTYESCAGKNYRNANHKPGSVGNKTAMKFMREFPHLNKRAINDLIYQDYLFDLKMKKRKEKNANNNPNGNREQKKWVETI